MRSELVVHHFAESNFGASGRWPVIVCEVKVAYAVVKSREQHFSCSGKIVDVTEIVP